MKGIKIKHISVILLFIAALILSSCGGKSSGIDKAKSSGQTSVGARDINEKYKVTFIELGSVKCIPCQQMQVVMKEIEAKYSKDVKVEFHDVWTEAGKPFGIKYGIEAIPTQVFLDASGKEYYRHVGFFPEPELLKILLMQGVKLN